MKNYTSTVDPAKSISMIEKLLIESGARQISKEYTASGEVAALSFSIKNPETELPIYVRMPAEPDAVFEAIKANRTKWLSSSATKSLKDQAKRTAWKLVWDWVAVQLSMVEMRQAEMQQVFLPYILVGNATTFYQQLKASQQPLLGYVKPAESEKTSASRSGQEPSE